MTSKPNFTTTNKNSQDVNIIELPNNQHLQNIAKKIPFYNSPITTNSYHQLVNKKQPKKENRAPNADIRDGIAGHPLTEIGNAKRLFDLYQDKLKYCPEIKAWLHWNDGCWEWDRDGSRTRELASNLPETIYSEGIKTLENDYYLKWARKSGERRTIDNAVKLLSDNSAIRVALKLIDNDPFIAGIDGGRQLIELRTGQVRKSNPSDYITKKLMVNQVGKAFYAHKWITFLNEIFLDDLELIEWFQRLLGYSLTGSTKEQIFSFGFGSGSNGKGVLMSVLREIWGDYYRTVAVETLMDQKRTGAGPSPDVADLVGARLVMSGETESGSAISESLIKLLTGEDQIKCRQLHKDPFEFIPQFKLFMAGNHKPVIKGIDNGIWRRIRLIPFEKTFSLEEQDKTLTNKLLKERTHILAWALDGCIAWQQRGLDDTPLRIKAHTESYRDDQDVIGQWINERCLVSINDKAMARDLYNDYYSWAEMTGNRYPLSEVKFSNNLSARSGITKKTITSGRIYSGLSLRLSKKNK